MNLYEYQAKQVFERYDIPIPKGFILSGENQIPEVKESLGKAAFGVMKAQVLCGGRGKAGGIRRVDSLEQGLETYQEMMGLRIKGLKVDQILLEEKLKIKSEYFLSFTLDPDDQLPALLISPKGGMDIEEVAKEYPEALGKTIIEPYRGLPSYSILRLLKGLDFPKEAWHPFVVIAQKLYRVFNECEATLVEINPLVLTAADDMVAADGRLNLDDNALFRHPDLAGLKAQFKEMVLKDQGVDYIDLGDGDIGLLCAGAGMTMLTMDLVQLLGGKAQCFIDISHGVNPEGFKAALEVLYSNSSVKFILLNMFGGLTRMDDVATSLLKAVDDISGTIPKPIVMRIQGTNAEKGQQILKDAGYHVYSELEDTLKCLKGMRDQEARS